MTNHSAAPAAPHSADALKQTDECRAEFEAWASHPDRSYDLTRGATGDYVVPETRNTWVGWQAARRQHGSAAQAVEPFDDYPDFNAEAMGCGLEDRGIKDRYDAMRYGWDSAIERVAERINGFVESLAAPPVADAEAPSLLNADELAALRRFDETCQDGQGYDVPKEMMVRLSVIGVIRRTFGSIYEFTECGRAALSRRPAAAHDVMQTPHGAAVSREMI